MIEYYFKGIFGLLHQRGKGYFLKGGLVAFMLNLSGVLMILDAAYYYFKMFIINVMRYFYQADCAGIKLIFSTLYRFRAVEVYQGTEQFEQVISVKLFGRFSIKGTALS